MMTYKNDRRPNGIDTGNCVDEPAAAGFSNRRANRTMSRPKSSASDKMTRQPAVTAGDHTPTHQPSGIGAWDFRDFGAFLLVNDPAWVRSAAAQDGPSLVSAIGSVGLDPHSSAAEA